MTGAMSLEPNDRALHGEVALVMGASRGIGAAIAKELSAQGASIVLVARDQARLQAVADDIVRDGGQAAILACDLTSPNSAEIAVALALSHFGRLDHLVNNAATISPVAKLSDADPAEWARNIRATLGGVYRNCRAALPVFARQENGVIVTLSSGAAHRPVDGWSAYCAGKAAALMFHRAMALETDPAIRVYSVQPGAVDTDMLGEVRAAGLSEYSMRERETLLPPELPARLVAYLCRARPADLNGQELTIRDAALRSRAGLPERDYS